MKRNPEELLPLPAFIRELWTESDIKTNRRTIQYYSSPRWRLLPPPTHKGKHVAYYKRKYITWVRLIILLRNNGWSLQEIKKLFENPPNKDLISWLANDAKTVSKVAWLISSIEKFDPSGSGLQPTLTNLVKVFFHDELGRKLKDLYGEGTRSTRGHQEITNRVHKEIMERGEDFVSKLQIISDTFKNKAFEKQIKDLLKEFQDKLEKPDADKTNWIQGWLEKIVLGIVLRL